MPFIGKTPAQGFVNSVTKDDFTPNGSTTAFTMSKAPATVNEIEVYVGNVRQEPTSAYSVSGTTLTMTEAPATNVNFYVMHIGGTTQSSTVVGDGTVTSAKIVSGAVTSSKLDTNIAISGTTTSTGLITATAGISVPSGQGINFSATGDGSGTMASELFDDYEEGTWVPEFRGSSGSAGSASTSVSMAQYTKIGRLVTIQCDLRWSTIGSWGGNLELHGLPFTVGVKGQGTPGLLKRIEITQKMITAVAYPSGTVIKFFDISSDLSVKAQTSVTRFNDALNEFTMTMSYSV
jgi:hypothetical protein